MASVSLRCIPDNRYAVIGVLNNKRARIEIETKANPENASVAKRTPVNIALILDRSGSMASNNKLEFAKKAVLFVLNLLHDDDVVHLVAYDDNVWTVFENARASARHALVSVVESIKTGGSTFLSGGIETGARLLEKYPHPGYSKRMFVLSDGLANVGLQSKEEIAKAIVKYREQGIIVDSFGIGSDFDEGIMKCIAEAGCGQFFFLETAEIIVTLITKALQSVFDVCGSQAQLTIRGRNDAIVTKIWGHANVALGAKLGDIHVDNLRAILCDFTVTGSGPEGAEVEVLDYELKYNPTEDVEGEPVSVKGTLSVIFINDESMIQEVDPKVKTLHAVQLAAEMDDRIAQLMDHNNTNEAVALITQQITLLREVEHLDDEKGMIAMLIRMAENMKKRLEEKKVNAKMAAKYYGHHGHMKKCYDAKYTHHYADEED